MRPGGHRGDKWPKGDRDTPVLYWTRVAREAATTMANLTITIDDRLLKQARMRALEDGTSVNALLRTYLERYAGLGDTIDALSGFARLAERSMATSGPRGRTWTRDELHDRTDLR
jgi:hypothetical protein